MEQKKIEQKKIEQTFISPNGDKYKYELRDDKIFVTLEKEDSIYDIIRVHIFYYKWLLVDIFKSSKKHIIFDYLNYMLYFYFFCNLNNQLTDYFFFHYFFFIFIVSDFLKYYYYEDNNFHNYLSDIDFNIEKLNNYFRLEDKYINENFVSYLVTGLGGIFCLFIIDYYTDIEIYDCITIEFESNPNLPYIKIYKIILYTLMAIVINIIIEDLLDSWFDSVFELFFDYFQRNYNLLYNFFIIYSYFFFLFLFIKSINENEYTNNFYFYSSILVI